MIDLIRRQDALDTLSAEIRKTTDSDEWDGLKKAMRLVSNIPSAETERKWIPVTEALPINDDWVIVSIYDDDGDTSWQYTTPGFYVPYGKCWIVDNEYCKNVIAWMPLPEPWRGE